MFVKIGMGKRKDESKSKKSKSKNNTNRNMVHVGNLKQENSNYNCSFKCTKDSVK